MAKITSVFSDNLIAYEGITTADGGVAGITLIDTVLTTKPDYNGNLLVITSGTYKGQAADINGTTLLGTVTPHTPFGGVILAGTSFTIYGIRAVPAEVEDLTDIVKEVNFDDMVFVDDLLGVNSTAYPYGTPTHPTSSPENAVIIATARNLKKIYVKGSHNLLGALSGYEVYGAIEYTSIVVNGQDISGTTFHNVSLGDTCVGGGGHIEAYESYLSDFEDFYGEFFNCMLRNTLLIHNAQNTTFHNCFTDVGGFTLDMTTAVHAISKTEFYHFSGEMTITDLTGGAIKISSSTGAEITIAASCTGGSIYIYGNANITDNSGAGCTVTHYDLIGRTKGLDDVHDDVGHVFDIVNAILTLTETGGVVSTSGAAEVDVYINNAPAGVYKPLILKIWFTNQTAAETVVIREKYRIEAGGGFIKADWDTFAGVQDPLLKNIQLDPTRFGVQVTIAKTAGADRDYKWEVIYDI